METSLMFEFNIAKTELTLVKYSILLQDHDLNCLYSYEYITSGMLCCIELFFFSPHNLVPPLFDGNMCTQTNSLELRTKTTSTGSCCFLILLLLLVVLFPT